MSKVEEVKKCTGSVCWFSSQKGIGFISPDDGGKDMFVHFSNLICEGYKTLKPGQIVEYEIGANDRGPQAVNVKVIKDVK